MAGHRAVRHGTAGPNVRQARKLDVRFDGGGLYAWEDPPGVGREFWAVEVQAISIGSTNLFVKKDIHGVRLHARRAGHQEGVAPPLSC